MSRAFRIAACRAIAAGVAFTIGDAHANEPTWRLTYAAPEGCPSSEHARSLVVARLGFDPFVEEAAVSSTLRMMVVRTEDARGLRIHVERLEDGHSIGERDLTDPSGNCSELVASAAFAASLLVDPTGEMRKRQAPRSEPPPDPRPTRADDPFEARPRQDQVPVRSPPPPRNGAHLLIGLRAIGSAGLAPSPSFGIVLETGLALGHFSIRLEGRSDFPSETALPTGRPGAKSSLILGTIVPCYAFGIASACALATAGAMLAESVNVDPVERDRAFFAAVGVRGGVEIPVGGPVGVVAHIDGLVPLQHVSIRTRGLVVWTAPPAALSAGAGVVVRFL